MKSIGIDAVEIDRFERFAYYRIEQLAKIFTQQEITYCLESSVKSAERFAVRFAAKEACYKAVSQLSTKPISFITTARLFEVTKTEASGIASLVINWPIITNLYTIQACMSMLSLTHTKTTAIALVMLI